MRASIILALASLMSNMTEAIKVNAADESDIDSVKLFATDDCTGKAKEVDSGTFSVCRNRWCKKADSVRIPVGKVLVVKYMEIDSW